MKSEWFNSSGVVVSDDRVGIYGGYEVKTITPANINANTNLTFTGRTVGGVGFNTPIPEGGYSDNRDSIGLNGTATLLFDPVSKKSTLNMAFGNWHDVRIEQTGNGTPSIAFSNWTGSDVNMQLSDATNMLSDNRSNFILKYYGDNNVPQEATGGVRYIWDNHCVGDCKMVEFNAAFGMKR